MKLSIAEGTTICLLDSDGACVAAVTVDRSDAMVAVVSIDTELTWKLKHQTVSAIKNVTRISEDQLPPPEIS